MRADIHDGPEHKRLQSKAGYIDARPHIPQLEAVFLQRTAGPYIGSEAACYRVDHVRFAPKADMREIASTSVGCRRHGLAETRDRRRAIWACLVRRNRQLEEEISRPREAKSPAAS